jgi:hypothetical protein
MPRLLVQGFAARPVKGKDGIVDLMDWTATVPGKDGTPWAGGYYKLVRRGCDCRCCRYLALFSASLPF